MAKSKEIEVLLGMLHSWLRCVSLEVLDMLCVGIHITVRPHIGGGRGLSSYERCGVSHCLRWYHPPGSWWNRVKQPYRSQRLVPLLGVGNRGLTYLAWMGGRGELLSSFIGNYQQHNGLSEAGSTIRFLSKVKQLNPDDGIIRKPSMSGHAKRGKRVF